ncbi:MAG: TniQ family protein [Alphaproteobacteria bacterium]|nr:TniQ family protein [Alphaproteobacteria bacterium]
MLQQDESFSSWFARVAEMNGLLPQELMRALFPRHHLGLYDLDRAAPGALIERLAAKTGRAAPDLRNATFARWAGTVFERDDGRTKLGWLPPSGAASNSEGGFGQQVCRHCLDEDRTPHLRLSWRLSFVTACADHAVHLINRCPSCGFQLLPMRRGTKRLFVDCARCGDDLRSVRPERASRQVIELQSRMLCNASDLWSMLDGHGPILSLAWFEILERLVRLFCVGPQARPLRTHLADVAQCATHAIDRLPPIRDFRALEPSGRASLLELASWMMTDWPRRFVGACRQVGVHAGLIDKHGRRLPYALHHAIRWNLFDAETVTDDGEVVAARAHLEAAGIRPTLAALRTLVGRSLDGRGHLTAPARTAIAWGTHRHWKLQGVAPEVRAAARTAAHRAGMNLGVWVDRALRSALLDATISPKSVINGTGEQETITDRSRRHT